MLLVVPSTLLQNWVQEFKKWQPITPLASSSSKGERGREDADFEAKRSKTGGASTFRAADKPVWVQAVSTKTHKTVGERLQLLR